MMIHGTKFLLEIPVSITYSLIHLQLIFMRANISCPLQFLNSTKIYSITDKGKGGLVINLKFHMYLPAETMTFYSMYVLTSAKCH
jgi:hypothetical protein